MYAACPRYCDKTHLGTVSSAREDFFLYTKRFYSMWSVLIRQLHYVSWKPGLLTFIVVLAAWGTNCWAIFSSRLQILETYWKIRETETTGERDAVSTLQSFPAAWAKGPSGPCPRLGAISSRLLMQTCPWLLSHTKQNNTGMKIRQKAIFTSRNPNFSSPFSGLSALCRPVFWW